MALLSFKISLANNTALTWNRTGMALPHGGWGDDGSDVPPEHIGPNA